MKDYIAANKKSLYLLGIFFIFGALFRFGAAYPVFSTGDSRSIVLQAGQIIRDGHLPAFFPGQAWMGIFGSYFLVGVIKILGASDLVFACYGFINSILFYLAAVLFTWSFFGISSALLTAFMFMFPSFAVMRWVPGTRPDYQIAFLMVPLILATAHLIVKKIHLKQSFVYVIFSLGLFTGFAFWTNMGTGPAGMVAILVVCGYGRLKVLKGFPLYVLGGVLGFLPVIYYNLTQEMIFFQQTSTFDNLKKLGYVMQSFFQRAVPYFWGVDFGAQSWLYKLLGFVFLSWVFIVYGLGLVKFFKSFKEKKDISPFILIYCYIALHLFITSASNFGSSYYSTGSPTTYLMILYGVIFAVPSAVIATCKKRFLKIILFAPVLFYFFNNIYTNRNDFIKFFNTVKAAGFSYTNSYPLENSQFKKFAQDNNLKYGYGVGSEAEAINLYNFGRIFVADFYKEEYVPYVLKADSSFNLFWANPPFKDLNQFNCKYDTQIVDGNNVAYNFTKEIFRRERIEPVSVSVSENKLFEHFFTDKNISTYWHLEHNSEKKAYLEILFEKEVALNEVVIFPTKHYSTGKGFEIELLNADKQWESVYKQQSIKGMFFSVVHPFYKIIKPRAEIVFTNNKKSKAYRISFVKEGTRYDPSINEMYFYTYGEKVEDKLYREKISDVIKFVLENGKGKKIIADHFFESFFKDNGFDVEFFSNKQLTSTGTKNPHLDTYLPVDLINAMVVVSSGDILSTRNLFNSLGVHYAEEQFDVFSVFTVLKYDKNIEQPQLYFTGMDFVSVASKGYKTCLRYPQLNDLFPSVTSVEYNFNDEFLLTEYVINKAGKDKIEILLGINSLLKKEQPAYLFVHLYNEKNEIVAQGDIAIMDQLGSFYQWGEEKHILKSILQVSEELKGLFQIKIGIWYPEEGRRVKLKTTGKDIITLSKINF